MQKIILDRTEEFLEDIAEINPGQTKLVDTTILLQPPIFMHQSIAEKFYRKSTRKNREEMPYTAMSKTIIFNSLLYAVYAAKSRDLVDEIGETTFKSINDYYSGLLKLVQDGNIGYMEATIITAFDKNQASTETEFLGMDDRRDLEILARRYFIDTLTLQNQMLRKIIAAFKGFKSDDSERYFKAFFRRGIDHVVNSPYNKGRINGKLEYQVIAAAIWSSITKGMPVSVIVGDHQYTEMILTSRDKEWQFYMEHIEPSLRGKKFSVPMYLRYKYASDSSKVVYKTIDINEKLFLERARPGVDKTVIEGLS